MIKERAMELVAALRSGKYTQTHARLKRTDGFCCLGVACDISGLGEWKNFRHGSYEYVTKDDHAKSDTSLPLAVQEYFGFTSSGGYFGEVNIEQPKGRTGHDLFSLIAMNDDGMTFSEIADFIEKNWEIL